MPLHLINGSYIGLISFIFLPESSFICIASFTIFIAIYTVHLNRVYDKANFYTGGWGKPILIYHMIYRLSRISNFNDRHTVKEYECFINYYYGSNLFGNGVLKRLSKQK